MCDSFTKDERMRILSLQSPLFSLNFVCAGVSVYLAFVASLVPYLV